VRWWAAAAVAVVACHADSLVPAPPSKPPPPIASDAAPAPVVLTQTPPFRLPHTFEPTRYRARLTLGETRLHGHIEIEGELSDQVSLIWLHGVDLVVTRAQAIRDGRPIDLEFSGPRDDQVLGLLAAQPLATGTLTLVIEYDGPIHDLQPQVWNSFHMKEDAWATGVFRRVEDGRTYFYTQGEAIYARQIFPCIDEPDRKVPWQLTLDVAKDAVAASNAAIVRETPLDRYRKRVEFAETRPLPSYLLAFAVGPFDVVDGGRAKSGVPIRILVQRGHQNKVAWAVPESRRILDFLEDWFEIPYPYGKLDFVSVPHTGWGAMENPGLVTFDQSFLERVDARSIIAHELSHQWFGDLVTMSWWDDIWLNESFAQWMAHKIERHLAGGVDDRISLREEALPWFEFEQRVRRAVTTTAALETEQFAPEDSLARGATVIMILESYLGPSAFRDAIRDYIRRHADHNASTDDLARVLERFAKGPISLQDLLDHKLPTISVALHCAPTGSTLEVTGPSRPMNVCVVYDRDRNRAETCGAVDYHAQIALPARSCPRWVMPNAGGIGLYRVAWTDDVMKPLLHTGWASLSHDERRDTFAEQVGREQRLQLFRQLATDTDAVAAEARYVAEIVRYVPDDLRARFDAWILANFGQQKHELHLKLRPPESELYDYASLQVAALAGDPQLAKDAVALAANLDQLPDDSPSLSLVIAIAAPRDHVLRDRLLDEISLDGSKRMTPRMWQITSGLAMIPTLVDALKADPSRLARIHPALIRPLFGNSCSSQALADLRELSPKNPRGELVPVKQVEQCVADKAKLDPIFRAWLAPKPSKR
jgi:alanyl aminopeptidase